MFQNLNISGSSFDIEFKNVNLLANSRIAMEAAEFARVQGMFNQFHEAVFDSYFTKGKNIGDINIILELAENIGLNSNELCNALKGNKYNAILEQVKEEAINKGINAAPTFCIEGKDRIMGAQSIEIFRKTILKYRDFD